MSTTVEDHGRVQGVGVPFAPGTEVLVTISRKSAVEVDLTPPDNEALAAARDRLQELFRTIKGFCNSPRIPREELYERGRIKTRFPHQRTIDRQSDDGGERITK